MTEAQSGDPEILGPQGKMAVLKKRLKNNSMGDRNEERSTIGSSDANTLPATRLETKNAVQPLATEKNVPQAVNTQVLASQPAVLMATPQAANDTEIQMETPPDEAITWANYRTNGNTPLRNTSALPLIKLPRSQDAPVMRISSKNSEMPLSRCDIIETKRHMNQTPN